MTYEEHHAALVTYLRVKVEAQDWHGVSDAANDLRVLEAQRQNLAPTADIQVCSRCGQRPYDGHDMCTGRVP